MDILKDIELFNKAILDIVLEVKPIREIPVNSTIGFLNKFSIPKDLQEFLHHNSFDIPFKIGYIYFNRVNDIEKENLDEQNINCIKEGLLIVGCGLNGDPVVIDS